MNTGADNVRIIEKVIKDRLKIQWPQLIQVAIDGANNQGCPVTVRTLGCGT